ncbi:MAG TPA: MBL fold metallo-hydrolase [Microvirga sp.]|jgi:glyoxylase-like metal-dependent hydrolase (beta-lactamase superfamily II)|nr:MBL fold metallo-hydrolase [Microvirga sp.]
MRTSQHSLPSRRGFCLCCLGAATFAATGTWPTPRQAFAQARNVVDAMRADAAGAAITVQKLGGNVSALVGSGGNIAVVTGPDGHILIDAGITASRPRIEEALNGLGRVRISHLINTHWHFDHADGNEWLRGQGAAIIAHENARKRLSEATRVADWDFNFPAAPAAALPDQVFSTERSLTLNGSAVELRHFGPAHTDGDAVVLVGDANILHAGDIYWNGVYPFIDYSTGGSIDGTIRAVEAILRVTTDGTVIVPGHGEPASNKAELRRYRDMLVAVREEVATLKRQGRTADDVVAARPTAEFDEQWSRFVVSPATFTRLVYAGV